MAVQTRMAENFAKMQEFSADGKGITRLAFSDEDWQARTFIISLLKQAGLTIRIDDFGNIIGRRQGKNPAAPAVLCGSHIDSVPHGGNFDGVLGVLGAIEAVNLMNENNFKNYNPIDIVVFMCEESSRFGTATLGSKAACGKLTVRDMKQYKDTDNKSLYDILHSRGIEPDKRNKVIDLKNLKACIEMHIEQGKVLENIHKPIGIVTGIAAPTRIKLELRGKADHSGATPMTMRNDALCAAAEIILSVENIALTSLQPVVGTVGIANVSPNVMNVIPGEVELGIDIRSIYAQAKTNTVSTVKKAIEKISQKRKIQVSLHTLADEQPVTLDDYVINSIENVCREDNIAYNKMPSGAGHDMMHLAEHAPTGMIFIPCRDGISHNAAEWADMKDILRGTDVLYKTLCSLSAADSSIN